MLLTARLFKISQIDTHTSAFRRWFGNSKVVTKSGDPLVVYHGSKSQWLTSFDMSLEGSGVVGGHAQGGIWFTSSRDNATNFADPAEQKAEAIVNRDVEAFGEDGEWYADVEDGDGNTLFVVGPFDTPEEAEKESQKEAVEYNKHLDEDTSVIAAYLRIVNPLVVDKVPRQAEFENAKKQGCDGIIAYEVVDGTILSDIFVVFSPKQVKSARRNAGTFDDSSNLTR